MTAFMTRTARATERATLEPTIHFALIDADLDESEKLAELRHLDVSSKLDAIQSSTQWLVRTLGAGVVSFVVLAVAYHIHP